MGQKRFQVPLAAKLSWSHFIELLSLKSEAARIFYANDAMQRNYGAKDLRRQICSMTTIKLLLRYLFQ